MTDAEIVANLLRMYPGLTMLGVRAVLRDWDKVRVHRAVRRGVLNGLICGRKQIGYKCNTYRAAPIRPRYIATAASPDRRPGWRRFQPSP